ncbi:MAG: hypothetical protein ACAI34_02825, partial [Verrucomicrobium sp.]
STQNSPNVGSPKRSETSGRCANPKRPDGETISSAPEREKVELTRRGGNDERSRRMTMVEAIALTG